MVNKFTQKAQNALTLAYNFAKEFGHSYIGTEHLLLGLIAQKESIASRILTLRGADKEKLKQSIIDYMGTGTKRDLCADDMTPALISVISDAADEAKKDSVRYVGTEHLLISLINKRDTVGVRLLEAEGVPASEIKADLAAYIGNAPTKARERSSKDEDLKHIKKQSLSLYGKDLTALAAKSAADPVLCREKETERLIRILCRRSKNNPCIVGEPGVGKTAVVEGLAQRIYEGNVPDELKAKRLITLDISSMLAGAKYRGEFEDRIKNVIDEVKSNPDIILFVDEMHIMVGAGAAEGAIDASNILKPALSRGEIKMIGATTPEEYRTHIEKDPAFERRFQPLMLNEPDESKAIDILFGLRERYEKHHGIEISDNAIRAAVRLSMRYVHDRFLPDKAIDLLDEAAAKIKLSSVSGHPHEYSLALLAEQKENALKAADFETVSRICNEERATPSSSLILLEPTPNEQSKCILTEKDIASVISEQSGIPVNALLESDTVRLMGLESSLNEKVIGQQSAIHLVASAIRRGRTGLANPNRPIGSFLFLGGTGVGKTELCRVLANTMFEGKNSLIKLDMSEYMEKQSISKLIGSPPGYVGYGEGGLLTQKVRSHPYCVVLFDEIEKAHPDVFNLLLQILEDGKLTDSTGRSIDFSSTVIIMTSNLLTAEDSSKKVLGFSDNSTALAQADLRHHKKLTDIFKGELLGRIDEIVLFSSLGEAELFEISELMLGELAERAEKIGISLLFDKEISTLMARKCAKSGSGARALRREITQAIETPLSEYILSGKAKARVKIFCNNDEISWEF